VTLVSPELLFVVVEHEHRAGVLRLGDHPREVTRLAAPREDRADDAHARIVACAPAAVWERTKLLGASRLDPTAAVAREWPFNISLR
jgi:hypothetical protein